jgi:phosphohistidine phosphatase SixA
VIRILLSILAFYCITATAADNGGESFNLYLVRHAEKQADGSRDPALTAAGIKRSEQLAGWLEDKEILKVWSSDYRRTRDTATPLLNSSGLNLAIYDPRDQEALAATLLLEKRNAVIIGHSNTIPELARLLCHCVIEDMDESEYGRLIVIAAANNEISVQSLQQGQQFQP